MIDVILARLADLGWDSLVALPLLYMPLTGWWIYRRNGRLAVAREAAALRCPHGVTRPKNCRPCIEALFSDEKPVVGCIATIPTSLFVDATVEPDVESPEADDPESGEESSDHLRRRGPLRIDIPAQFRDGHDIVLQLHTAPSGITVIKRIAVAAANGMRDLQNCLPPGQVHHLNLSMSFGRGLRAVILENADGIERVQIIAGGMQVVDCTPEILYAVQELH